MGQTPHHMTRTQGTLHDTVRCTEVHTRHMVQVLRVFPDYAADPVWGAEGMVDLDSLLIGEDLKLELREWARDWEDQVGRDYRITDHDRHAAWLQLGRRLAKDLARELGPEVEVSYEA